MGLEKAHGHNCGCTKDDKEDSFGVNMLKSRLDRWEAKWTEKEKNAQTDSENDQVDRLEASMWPALQLRTHSCRIKLDTFSLCTSACVCVPELMTHKANELAVRHASLFLYYTASLMPWTPKQSCLNPETTAVLSECQQDESVLRREHRLTPGSDLQCNTFFFNGTSCCIQLHQIDCSASGRLFLKCFVFTVRTVQRSSEQDLFFKGKERKWS